MPENKLSPPSQVLGNSTKLPPPDAVLNNTKSSGTDYSFLNGIQSEAKTDEIIGRLDTKNDDEKSIIKNMAIAQKQGKASNEDVSNAILTIQGQHPKQGGGNKYYMKEENGVYKPIPLSNDEKPPKGYDVASIWGSQESANDNGFLKSAAKHLVNGVIGAAEGVANLPQIAYGAVTGEELPWYQTVKNSADYLKFKIPDYEKTGEIFDTKNLEGVSDFFDPSRYDFSKNNIQGAVLSGLESITSFLVGAKGINTIGSRVAQSASKAGLIEEGGDAAQALYGASNAGKKAQAFTSAYMINYDEALNAAEDAGLTGQNKYAFASISTIPTALLEVTFGTEGLFVKNSLAREGKTEMLKSLAKGVEKETNGKLTKESLQGLYNATTTAATKLNGTFVGQVAKNVGEEAGTEAAQAFALNSAKNIYDKVSGEEKFKTDPFSLQSFGEYVNNALAGGLGAGGPAVVGVSQKRKIDKAELQSNNAYETAKKGSEAISALKADIDNSVATGELTPIQGEHAKFKVDVYNEYHNQTKGLDLNDEDKKKVIEIAYNIQGIKTEIPTEESDIKKLSPIELAQVQGKKELVKGLQKELDAIVLKENVRKETSVGPDTINKVEKNEEKKVEQTSLSELSKRYGKAKPDVSEKVKEFVENTKSGVEQKSPEDLQFYENNKEEIEKQLKEVTPEKSERRKNAPKFEAKDVNGTYEFNKQKPLEKKEILHEYFDEHPELNNEMDAHIEQGQNNVWKLDLGDKRYVQFGRAVVPNKYTGEIKNFPGGKEIIYDTDGREMIRYKVPVVVKLETITGTKPGREGKRLRILNVYNKETGKYIVSVKEREKGDSDYHSDEIEQMVNLQKEGIKPRKAVKQEETKPASKGIKISDSERNTLLDEGYSEKDIKEAEKTSNEAVRLPNTEMVDRLEKRGLFNSVGKTEEWRPNIGLSTADFKSALKNLKAGKETVAAKMLSDFLDKIKQTGKVEMIGQTGGMTEKFAMPLHQFLLGEKSERELTPEEVDVELEKELAREEAFAETGQFQKESSKKEDIDKVVERIKKAFPKVNVMYNPDLDAAGRLKGNTIEINPDYAGIDTPIHEAGHILIDAIGYNNKVIQAGIKQLKDIPLWAETKERYPELNEEQLGKEVLAEAIGREGANVFDSETAKSKFKAVLDYIFNKLKQLLGIDRSVAKSLAKQIIGGVKTKGLTGQNEEGRFAKKKNYKTIEEMSAKDLSKKLTMTLEAYRENVLGRSVEQIRKDLQFIDEALQSDNYDKEQKEELKAIRENIKKEEKRDVSKWIAYKEDVEMLSSIMSEGRLEDMNDDRLIEAYNLIQSGDFQDAAKDAKLNQLKIQVAYRMFLKQKEFHSGNEKFIEEQANKKDLSAKDVLMKNLGHMTQNQPELQAFDKMFGDAYFNIQEQRYDLKSQLEKLGKDVIKEKNKSIGITDRAKEFVMSGAVKYFDFVEHPDGRYYTLEEAQQKGFSAAQTKFLKFMLHLNELRNNQLADMGTDEVNNEVLKVDKGVREAFKEEGLLQAFSAFLGNGHNIQNVRIMYKGQPMAYGDIEQELIKEGNKGTIDKMKALLLMAKYQLAARRQIKSGINVDEKDNPLALTGGSEYNLSTNGQLKSKFNRPRDASRGYSKDFYKAAHSFIDDYTHVKNMQPILPYIQSIEYLNRVGFAEHGVKNNTADWVKQWTDLHIFKKEKVGALGPEFDSFMKLLRKLTSLNVMAFAYKAGGFNAAIGIYNNIRQESLKEQVIGTKRMVSDYQKSVDLIKKYGAVSLDLDSNPKMHAGKIFEVLAHGLTRGGEFYVQGSMFLGKMTETEWNSFEYKDVNGTKELVLKDDAKAKEIKDKMIDNIKRISDVQGKYADRDRRNYQAGEFGKMISQFKIWIPDFWKTRLGEEYIDANGVTHKGTYRAFVGQGFTDLKEAIRKDGIKGLTQNKEAMANLKGLMVVGAFLALRFSGDDKDRKKGDLIDQALGNLLFIFDVNQLKFIVENPVAALGTVKRFVAVMEDAMKGDIDKGVKDIEKAVPYSRVVKEIDELVTEE